MRAATLALLLALAGCQGSSTPVQPLLAGIGGALPQTPTSDLLARARAALRGGRIDAGMRAALAASTRPADREAARLLAALDAPASAPEPEPPEEPGELSDAPRIKMGTAPPPENPVPKRASSASPRPTTVATAAPPPAAKPRAMLERVGLSSTKKGAALSLRGSGGLVVGVASQPASGIVRLVMDAEASTGALRSRPRITGARVTGIRRTGKTVFVTLALDPGWSLRGIVRTRSGARVDLNRPA